MLRPVRATFCIVFGEKHPPSAVNNEVKSCPVQNLNKNLRLQCDICKGPLCQKCKKDENVLWQCPLKFDDCYMVACVV